MKNLVSKLKIFITIMICNFTVLSDSLDAQNIPEPEFDSRLYVLTIENKLENVERVDAVLKNKYGSTKLFYKVKEKQSEVRFPKNSLPIFIIKTSENVDPNEEFTIVFNDERAFPINKISEESTLKIEYRKIRDNVFQIVFPDGLNIGEYAIVTSKDQSVGIMEIGKKTKLSCFGID